MFSWKKFSKFDIERREDDPNSLNSKKCINVLTWVSSHLRKWTCASFFESSSYRYREPTTQAGKEYGHALLSCWYYTHSSDHCTLTIFYHHQLMGRAYVWYHAINRLHCEIFLWIQSGYISKQLSTPANLLDNGAKALLLQVGLISHGCIQVSSLMFQLFPSLALPTYILSRL